MSTLIQEILRDIDWRTSELASLKTIPLRYRLSTEHKQLLIKYSVPPIYSIWEGYVKSTFTLYSSYLNSLSIKRNEISLDLLTHQVDLLCQLNNPRVNFDKKKKLVATIDKYLADTLQITPGVPTESNVNFIVINKILERFCIRPLDKTYEKKLDKLIMFRNMLAHGENSLKIETKNIEEFTKLVQDLMIEIVINLEYCINNKTYLK